MPRSAKDNELIRAARQGEIFRAAGRVFARKGFAATKIADIAAEAKLSHGLLYHYYRSKEEVYAALFHEIISRRPSRAEIMRGAPAAIDRIERLVSFWLEKAAERPELTVLVTQALVADNLPGATRETFVEYARTAYEELVRDLELAQAAGDAERSIPAEELATALLSLVRGLATMRFIHSSTAMASSPGMASTAKTFAQSLPSLETVLRVVRPTTAAKRALSKKTARPASSRNKAREAERPVRGRKERSRAA